MVIARFLLTVQSLHVILRRPLIVDRHALWIMLGIRRTRRSVVGCVRSGPICRYPVRVSGDRVAPKPTLQVMEVAYNGEVPMRAIQRQPETLSCWSSLNYLSFIGIMM